MKVPPILTDEEGEEILKAIERRRMFNRELSKAKKCDLCFQDDFLSQSRPGLCGIAAVRNILSIQFNIEASEQELLELLYSYYAKKYRTKGKLWFEKNGTSPSALAYLLRRRLIVPVKIFCSKKGNISLLEHFRNKLKALPIIHCNVLYPEIGMVKPEGHYMMYGKVDNKSKKISVFNPSVGRGWEYYSEKEFLKKWETKGERWFMVVLAEEVKLDAERCKGKYL